MSKCIEESCPRESKHRGLCGPHYQKFRRDGSLEDHALPVSINPKHHRLTDRDTLTETAICSICGPTPMFRKNRAWECRTKVRIRNRKYRYGESDENSIPIDVHHKQRQELEATQGGKCAICLEEKPLQLDHCHSTGKIRGLLCMGCNVALGRFNDDPDTLQRAIDYLG